MIFVYDTHKSSLDQAKHGIDFEKAQKIWDDREAILNAPATSVTEERWLAIGKVEGRLYSAIYPHRGETIRLISVRPAHEDEKEAYEG